MQITAELQAAFDYAERRDRFWADNYQAFLETYPEQYVAAKDGKIVAAEDSFEQLLDSIRALGLSPQHDVWMKWISKSMAWLVL